MSLTVSKSREEFGAELKPIDTDLVVVSAIVNALRTLNGDYLGKNYSNWMSSDERRQRAISMAAEYLGI